MKYKEFEYMNKNYKHTWYSFIFNKKVYIEYLGNIYEHIGMNEENLKWIISNITNGDSIEISPSKIFSDDKFQFIKEI